MQFGRSTDKKSFETAPILKYRLQRKFLVINDNIPNLVLIKFTLIKK